MTRDGAGGPRTATLTVHRLDGPDRPVVRLVGELDLSTRDALLGCAECWAPSWASGDLAIEVGGLTFCDAAGLSALVEVAAMVAARGGRVGLAGASRRMRRLLSLTGLAAVLPLLPADVPDGGLPLPDPAPAG